MDAFMASILMFGGTFAPLKWAFCGGQVLAISQFSALYSLLGVQYGGDGRTTFALPDLRGRVPAGSSIMGSGIATTAYPSGTRLGSQTATLTELNMPSHTHVAQTAVSGGDVTASWKVWSGGASSPDPIAGGRPAGGQATIFAATKGFGVEEVEQSGLTVASDSIDVTVVNQHTGSGNSFDILNPITAIPFIISVDGIYPSRN